ncbi:GNAT family N-acetyltransferase [Roseibium suaedae]|nr:GNAT family N-acetyltransferase [Roseibium suaedae]
MTGYAIRPARAGDRDAVAAICLRTANKGQDASTCYSDPDYPGFVWALPYLALDGGIAFVLTRDEEVVGYAVGTADTRAFEQEQEKSWWPELRSRLAEAKAATDDDRYVLDYVRTPESLPEEIVQPYPAHLHINLLPEAQGEGRGTRLLATLLDALAAAGASGVHLGVNHMNEPVTAFYGKLGFTEIARLPSIIMARPL